MKVYTLTLTEQEIAIIGQLLGRLEYRTAAPLIKNISTQLEAQHKPPVEVATGPKG